VEAEGQYSPGSHTVCVAGVVQKNPALQRLVCVVPVGQYWPDTQASCVADVEHTKPAVHSASSVLPLGQ